jgi:hypothetical protein
VPSTPAWLSYNPTQGSTPPTGEVTVQVNTAGLAPGTYKVALVILIQFGEPNQRIVTVPLTLVVSNQPFSRQYAPFMILD